MVLVDTEREDKEHKTFSTFVGAVRKERTGILARLENSELDALAVLVHQLFL